jgi:hypothetical protein
METIKLAIALFVIGVKAETLALVNGIWKSIKAIWEHLCGLVHDVWTHVTQMCRHVVLVPAHVVLWVVGLVRSVGVAVGIIWSKV